MMRWHISPESIRNPLHPRPSRIFQPEECRSFAAPDWFPESYFVPYTFLFPVNLTTGGSIQPEPYCISPRHIDVCALCVSHSPAECIALFWPLPHTHRLYAPSSPNHLFPAAEMSVFVSTFFLVRIKKKKNVPQNGPKPLNSVRVMKKKKRLLINLPLILNCMRTSPLM